jgi:sugar phosphate permease
VQLGLFLSLHGIIYGLSRFVNGIISDRNSPRIVLSVGLFRCARGNILCGFSDTSAGWIVTLANNMGTTEGFSFTDGTVFTLWISDDRNKIPLSIESPVRIGSIQAYIYDFKGLKYPLESLIK